MLGEQASELTETRSGVAPAKPAKKTAQGRLWFWLRIAVALGMVIVILRLIDVNTAVRTISQANPGLVVLIFPLLLIDRYLMGYKWAMLLRAQGISISNWQAFSIYMSSTFVGTVLPTGVGSDVYRAVRTTLGGPKMNVVTASIVVERMLGIVALAILAVSGLGILAGEPTGQFRALFYTVGASLVAFLVVFGLSIQPGIYDLITGRLKRFAHVKPVRLFMKFHSAYIEMSKHRKLMAVFVLLSILEQALGAIMAFLGSQALGFNLSVLYFLALIPLSRFITLLPLSIGGIGVTEGTYVVAFSLAGLSPADSLSIALLIRVMNWVFLVPAGIVFLYDSAKFKRERQA